jgi:transposase InsO family protein
MTKDFKKVYLQLVVDNYSRAILSFKTGYLKDANLSLRTIRSIKLESSGETFLLSDGGGENRNVKLSRVLIGKGITQLIAKSDVAYSNSIVEAVFRQMKRVEAIRAPRSLHSFYSSIEAYVNEHNTVVPHSSLKGALPGEVFNGRTHLFDYKTHLKNLRMLRLQNQVNPKLKCKSCLVTARSADFSLTKNT